MMKGKFAGLAADWMKRSHDDEEMARQRSANNFKDSLKMMARTRRNCAWELLRLLDDAEKANPSEEGLTRPLADRQSA
jgi:hypothetical protein